MREIEFKPELNSRSEQSAWASAAADAYLPTNKAEKQLREAPSKPTVTILPPGSATNTFNCAGVGHFSVSNETGKKKPVQLVSGGTCSSK